MLTDLFYDRDSTRSTCYSIETNSSSATTFLNEYGLSHESEDLSTGEYNVLYRVRDIDFRGRRIDSNAHTRSFGMSSDIMRFEEAYHIMTEP
ncbi:hypothetical protein C8Q76DRAFT_160625 [Earliella scabrosa]|nr:hypothetical protein C8Q76DRAFT_160625 [Earliella scabrosa]